MLGAMFGIGFILGPVMGGLLGAHRPAAAVLRRRRAGAAEPGSTATSCCPSRCRRSGAAPFDWQRANPLASLQAAGRSSRASACWSAVVGLRRAGAVHRCTPSWVLYTTFKFGWGPTRERLVAVRRRRDVGDRAGRPAGRLLKRFSPQRLAVLGLVSSTLAYLRLGPGHRGLDDVRRDRRQPARLHRGGGDAEPDLQRRRRTAAGPDHGRGEPR